ncbi:hypothetical protein NBRC116494_34720 [Aurantivibrio plasticivorans]
MKPQSQIFPNFYPFQCWSSPASQELGESALDFLHHLNGPTHLYLPGQDGARSRVIVTLLHGNEPSGLIALYHLLKMGIKPAVDIHCIIASVAAAKSPPTFHYRMLPGQKDLNRCFSAPFEDNPQDQLAKGILETIEYLQPEAVIDVHNTSGSGPSFGVTTFMDPRHDALVSLFTQRMIVTDLNLGALMEISEHVVPTVTIECGGAADMESHLLAQEGIEQFVIRDDVLTPPQTDFDLELFHNPIRLELTENASIIYEEVPQQDVDLTLSPSIEHLNFGFVDETNDLGFLNTQMEDVLRATNSHGEEVSQHYFQTDNGILRPTQQLKFFMVTTNPEIAKKDCLFYFVTAD